jgi:hypothetical protein
MCLAKVAIDHIDNETRIRKTGVAAYWNHRDVQHGGNLGGTLRGGWLFTIKQ